MKVLQVTHSYILPDVSLEEVYSINRGVQDYKRFLQALKVQKPDIIHIHTVGSESSGIYAFIARYKKVKVIRTMHSPIHFSKWFILKQLAARFFYSYTIVNTRFDLQYIDRFHIASKSKRALIYGGIDQKKSIDHIKKDAARAYLYKKLGISFAKNIKIVGTVIEESSQNGVEHYIDAAYLADKYKNLTNTIFVICSKGKIGKYVYDQIQELHIEGICFVIEDVFDVLDYLKAFDVFVSPRTNAGDLYILLRAYYMRVPVIATKVGDTFEFEQYIAAPLVPKESAKFLTEAIMFVLKNTPPVKLKSTVKEFLFPKRFTCECEENMIRDVYAKVIHKKGW